MINSQEIFKSNAQLIVKQVVGDQKNLANALGVSEQTISNWIKKSPKVKFLLWLEDQSGHNLNTLYNEPLTIHTWKKNESNNSLAVNPERQLEKYKLAYAEKAMEVDDLRKALEKEINVLSEVANTLEGMLPKDQLEDAIKRFGLERYRKGKGFQ